MGRELDQICEMNVQEKINTSIFLKTNLILHLNLVKTRSEETWIICCKRLQIVQHMFCLLLFICLEKNNSTDCVYPVCVYSHEDFELSIYKIADIMPENSTFLGSFCQSNAPVPEMISSRFTQCLAASSTHISGEHVSLSNIMNEVSKLLERGCVCVLYFTRGGRAKNPPRVSQAVPEISHRAKLCLQ